MTFCRRTIAGAITIAFVATALISGLAAVPTAAAALPAAVKPAASSLLTNGSFEGSLAGWSALGGFAAASYNDLSVVHDGQWVANGFTSPTGGSLLQDVSVGTSASGQSYVGSLWVKSADGSPYTGSVVLWGLGGSDVGVTYFTTTGSAWSQVRVPLSVHSASLTGIRFQLYASTVGHNLDFDGAQLGSSLVTNGSFEGSMNGWSGLAGFAAASYNDLSVVHDGQWVANGFTPAPLGSLFQDVSISGSAAGQSYVGSLWVRSTDGSPYSGSLVLWGLGSSDVGVTNFTTTGTGWSQVQVPLDVHSGSVTGIRYQIYASTVGHNLTFDGAELRASLVANGSFEGSLSGWSGLGGFAAASYNDLSVVHDGQWVANGFAPAPLGSLFQDVSISGSAAGQSYVGSVWVRSTDGSPYSGSLVLWGLGSSDVGVTSFTTTGTAWTQVQAPLDVHSASVTGIRFQLYAATTGHNLTFDGAQLAGPSGGGATSVLAARAASTSAWLSGRAGVAGFTLIDTATGTSYGGGSPDAVIRTASVIKVPIAMTLISKVNAKGRALTAAEQSDLRLMITQSDNNAATRLWNEVGGSSAVVGLMHSLGASANTRADAGSPSAWGFTLTTSRDLAVVLGKLAQGVLGPSGTSVILSLMHQVIPSQSWGIAAAVPGSAIKNGWYPEPTTWRVNCLGIVQGTRYALAVMTRYPIGLGQGYGEQTCQGVAAGLFTGPGSISAAIRPAAAPAVAPANAAAEPARAIPAITGIGMTADGG